MRIALPVLAILVSVATASRAAVGDTDAQEQAAIRAAVDRAAPAVVRVETIGGLERLGHLLFGAGPTTGLVVDADGYIISSAFNFVNKPTSILVRLPDGARKPAKLVATDHSRMLVLLKIDVDKPLTVCESVPVKEMRVGQWTIGVGRCFDGDRPNMTVGILSALDRVWGKAIQTDAAVSPNNYGGPLVDIRGRVLGVLVPLSPETADEMAGVEWYDSGIGFAIPMEHVQSVLPRLKNGADLYPGRAGLALKGPNLYTGEPIIAVCQPKCPAAVAGLKPGDRIVEIDGRKTARTADVKQEIGRRYAGEKMRVTVLRGKDRIDYDLILARPEAADATPEKEPAHGSGP
jgi:serine protease Do